MSAIATILGLLLVVSFVANYLATTLPSQMALNDANRALMVEDQLGHLDSVLQSLSVPGALNAPVIQPISLGSPGAPPFAGPDGARITGVPGQSSSSMSVGLYSTFYNPPSGFVPKIPDNKSCIGDAPYYNLWSCGSQVNLSWYYSSCVGLPSCVFNFSATGGATFVLNYVLNNTSINISATGNGGGVQNIGIYGSHDNATLTIGGGTSENVTIVGNYDNVTLYGTGNQNYFVFLVGSHISFTAILKQGSSNVVNVKAWGTYITVNPSSGGNYVVVFTGFVPQTSTGVCPMGNLAMSTDSVTQPNKNTNGNGTVTFNDTTGPTSAGRLPLEPFWWAVYQNPTPSSCPFYATFRASAVSGLLPASLVVALLNQYSPYAEVALDQGAVVYAQSGAVPVMVDPPAINYNPASGQAIVWAPAFLNPVKAQQGTGTSVVTLNQAVSQVYRFPTGTWLVNPSKPLRLSYQTPYYTAWMTYFCSNPTFGSTAILNLTMSGTPVSQNCSQYLAPGTGHASDIYVPFSNGGILGLVTVTIPAKSVVLKASDYTITTS